MAGISISSIACVVADVVSILAAAVVVSAMERRIMAAIHRRDGPNAHGILGLLQPVADGVKLFLKGTYIAGILSVGSRICADPGW